VVAGWLLLVGLADGLGQVSLVFIQLPIDDDGVDVVAAPFHSVEQSKVGLADPLPCLAFHDCLDLAILES
jgi:hypothetical protein